MNFLSEMTLDELWQLFPVILKPHNPEYNNWYNEEAEKIASLIGAENISRISHIGSTAVPGLDAKPTVDILLEIINKNIDLDILEKSDWMLMSSKTEPYWQRSFNKGYTPLGFADRVFHLHIRMPGSWGELYFRDYLIEHPKTASDYAALKKLLALKYRYDRDKYTDAKSEFINRYTEIARKLYTY